jgi:hypothetical protein
LQDFEKSVQNGSVTYKDIELFVGQFFEGNYEKTSNELSIICLSTNKKLIGKRVEQYKQCREVIAKAEIAGEILEIQRIYELTGNFKPIEKISQVYIYYRFYSRLHVFLVDILKCKCKYFKLLITGTNNICKHCLCYTYLHINKNV